VTQPTPPDTPGPRRPATLADLDAVPSTHTGHLINGKLYAFPRPRHGHEKAQYRLGVRLSPFDPQASGPGGPGGWLFLMEPELHIGSERAVPDLAGWLRPIEEGLLDPYPTIPPAWICEILSPRTEAFDRGEKATWFLQIGVRWLWFITPEERLLEVYESDAGAWRQRHRFTGSADVAAPPFRALTWPLGSLWG